MSSLRLGRMFLFLSAFSMFEGRLHGNEQTTPYCRQAVSDLTQNIDRGGDQSQGNEPPRGFFEDASSGSSRNGGAGAGSGSYSGGGYDDFSGGGRNSSEP